MSEPVPQDPQVVPLHFEDLSVAAALQRANELMDIRELDQARQELTHALANHGEHKELLLRLAEVEQASGRYGSAMSYFEQAVAFSPLDPETVSQYVRFLCDFGMQRQALSLLSGLSSETSQDPRVRAARGSIYLSAKWYALALAAYGEGADLAPDAKRARRRCWLRSGGPVALIRRRAGRFGDDAVRAWYSAAANLPVLGSFDYPQGFSAAMLGGELDSYIRAFTTLTTQWEAARGWLRRRMRYVIVAVTWLAVFMAEELFWHGGGPAAAPAVATVTTACAYLLWPLAAGFGNAAHSFPGLAVRGAAATTITIGGGITLITRVAAPPAWPGVLGLILMATLGMVTCATAIIQSVWFITYIRLRELRRKRPRAAVLHPLIDLVSEIARPDTRNDFNQRAIWMTQLEAAALRTERLLPKAIACGDPQTDKWIADRARGAASALRRMKRRIAAPSAGSWDRLICDLRQDVSALASGDLASLRWAPPPPPEVRRQQLLQMAVAAIRVVVVTAVPIGAVIVLQLVLKLNSHYIAVAWIASISWAVIYLLATVDPTVPGKVELARGIISGISGPKQQHEPQE